MSWDSWDSAELFADAFVNFLASGYKKILDISPYPMGYTKHMMGYTRNVMGKKPCQCQSKK